MPANGTIDQKLAEAAFLCVETQRNLEGKRLDKKSYNKYGSFALTLPSLIHTCGLAQAVAFAKIKEKDHDVLADLAKVLTAVEPQIDGSAEKLIEISRTADVLEYMRLSRRALLAASWIKRWCQAFDDDAGKGENNA